MTHREKRSLSLVLLSILLGTVNQFFLKPRFGLAVPFLSWYANDIIAGFLILAFTHYLLARGRLPALSRRGSLLLVLGAGAAWEVLPLLWKPAGVADPWDIAAYLAGGFLCDLLLRPEIKK